MRRWLVVVAILLLLPPAVGQETLADRLREINFDNIIVTVHGDKIVVDGDQSTVAGERAAELRQCIDNNNCPDPNIAALSRGNADGQVSAGEVEAFEKSLKAALNLAGDQVEIVRDKVKTLVKIDGKDAAGVRIERIAFRDADATITSSAPVRIDADATASFNSADKGKHTISMARTETSLEIADRFVIRPAEGWSIVKGSIQPADLQNLYNGREIVGTQSQIEGTEPLTFTIEQDTNWTLWITLGLLALVAAGILTYVLLKRRRNKASPAAPAPAKA